ncbi:MAG: TlpA family protein disulfide reductase [Candidatus Sabulitectum sp.]|nr:TlpA family protein disulfide reductase [Candidatus Sabulitectum sp.]
MIRSILIAGKHNTRRFLLFAVLFFILSISDQGYTAEPYRIFAQSDSVLSCINGIEYSFSFQGTGALSNIMPVLKGRTSVWVKTGVNHPMMYHSIESIISSGAIGNIVKPYSYAAFEETVYLVDHVDSLVFSTDYSRTSGALFDFPPASVMMEFVVSNPFRDEILSDSIAVLVPIELDGVLCHVFHVFYQEEDAEAVWFLGMDDLLPRAVERIGYYGSSSIPGGQILEISNLTAECPTEPSWHLPLPGYTSLPWLSLLDPSMAAPAFFLSDLNGHTVRSTEFSGKTLLLCFFSSWDPSSLSALGLLKSIGEDFSGSVQAVGISIMETTDPAFRLSSLGLDFPVLIFGESTAEDYNVHSVPAVFLVSDNNEILYSSQGIQDNTVFDIRVLIERSL